MTPKELRPPNGLVDIFALHSRLNVQAHSQILHSDAVYVTVVRDPPYLFESIYSYFNLTGFLGMTLDQYLSMPLQVCRQQ